MELFRQDNNGLSVKEISDAIGLNKSTAFGLINTLSNLGYLQQNRENHKYMPGLKLLGFSNAIDVQSIIRQAVHPHLYRLAHKFGETTNCGVEYQRKVLYIDKVDISNAAIFINTQIGVTRDMHCSGMGKCLLAYASSETLSKILSEPLMPLTPNTITDPARLQEELAAVRQRGYAYDLEEYAIGLYCIAVPVFSAPGSVKCALSISTIEPRMRMAEKNGIIEELRQTARMVSAEVFHYDPEEQ